MSTAANVNGGNSDERANSMQKRRCFTIETNFEFQGPFFLNN